MIRTGLTILGIESSCDETAAAVVHRAEDGRLAVMANRIHSQTDHDLYGGVVPEIAARAHMAHIGAIVEAALHEAKAVSGGIITLDGVAATAGPGLVGGVMVGLSFAKGFALGQGLPLVAVNHLEGHALSARLNADVEFPYLLLLVSGGHCQLLSVTGVGHYDRLGTTMDDAAGEAFDKIAKILDLGYPGGPALEAAARQGDATRFALPRARPGARDSDFSFSGLKTAAARLAFDRVKTHQDRADLCAAVQAAITRQLVDQSQHALDIFRARHGPATLVVAGGVAANATIRFALQALATKNGFDFSAPDMSYCTDNAAMIALAGLERLGAGLTDGDLLVTLKSPARPRWPLDELKALRAPVHKKTGRKGAKA